MDIKENAAGGGQSPTDKMGKPTEVPASKNGQAAPRRVQYECQVQARQKEGLKPPPLHCYMAIAICVIMPTLKIGKSLPGAPLPSREGHWRPFEAARPASVGVAWPSRCYLYGLAARAMYIRSDETLVVISVVDYRT
eukprot:6190368-Pleurochrysis_carterae.AAC.4